MTKITLLILLLFVASCIGGDSSIKVEFLDERGSSSSSSPAATVYEIKLGDNHSCFRKNTELRCFGSGALGQLGHESTSNIGDSAGSMGKNLSAINYGNVNLDAFAVGGNNTCVITTDKRVKCFGDNGEGQVGNKVTTANNLGDQVGEMGDNLTFLDINPNQASTIAVGKKHSCILHTNGVVQCFGDNQFGQLGQENSTDTDTPVTVNLPATPSKIVAGDNHTCALAGSNVYCWGKNTSGQLGIDSNLNVGDDASEMGANLKAVKVSYGQAITTIAAGANHTCILYADGNFYCFGKNNFGQLGQDNSNTIGHQPNSMATLSLSSFAGRQVKDIKAGGDSTCALLDDKTLRCFGANDSGQLGQGHSNPIGTSGGDMAALSSIDFGTNVLVNSFDVGSKHVCILTNNNAIKCIGNNENGQLGNETTASVGSTPTVLGDNLPEVPLDPNKETYSISVPNETNATPINTTLFYTSGNNFDQVKLSETNDCSAGTYQAIVTSGSTIPVTVADVEEVKYISARYRNSISGEESDCVFATTSYIKSAAADGTITAASITNDIDVDVEFTFSSSSEINYGIGTCPTPAGSWQNINSLTNKLNKTITLPNTDGAYNIVAFFRSGLGTSTCKTSLITLDTIPPAASTTMTWSISSPTNVASAPASWTTSIDGGLTSQAIQYYSDGSCGSTSGSSIALSAAATSHTFTFPADGDYSYKITSIDAAGNFSESACSATMTSDTGLPAQPGSLAWSETSPHDATPVTATWIPATDLDLDSQSIQYYNDGTCGGATGSPISLGKLITSHGFTGASDGVTYSFKVTSIDTSGNQNESSCSPAMLIDTTAPNDATNIAWVETSPITSSSATMVWTISSSIDVDDQTIQMHNDGSCSSAYNAGVVVNSLTNTSVFNSVADGTYTYEVIVKDLAGNTNTSSCSSAMFIDSKAPAKPFSLTWSAGLLANATDTTATWNLSPDTDVISQEIQYYLDGTCGTPDGSASPIGAADTTNVYTGSNGNIYSYEVTAIDGSGNRTTSDCSSSVTIDTDPPAAATNEAWSEISPHNTTSVAAVWTLSAAGDIASQSIQFHDDGSCGSPFIAAIPLSATTTSKAFVGVDGETYSFRHTTIDNAGNTTDTGCSTAMAIDTTDPIKAISVTWAEAPGSVTPTVHANWTPSTSIDVSSQSLQFYDDGTCGNSFGSPIILGSSDSSRTFNGTDGETYSYRILTTDTADNTSLSDCSASIVIDATDPSPTTSLGWTETSPHNSTQVTSSWVAGLSTDIITQSIEYFNSNNCTSSVAVVVLDHTPTTNIFVGADNSTYTYRMTTYDAAGNNATSSCSDPMHLDATAPGAATLLAWAETTPVNDTTATVQWTLSAAIDVKSQSIQFYDDNNCGTADGAAIPLSPTTNSMLFTGNDGTTYTYKVITYDKANNLTESTCSTAMLLDASAPVAPGVAGWTETNPHNATSLTAQWVTSSSGDVASQSIQYHDNDSCSSPYSSDTVGATDTTVTFVGVNNTTFTYVVTAIDGANNSTPGPCSSAMYIDMDPPTDAASLAWSETHPHDASTINARWTISPSNDVASQSIQFYTGDTCGVTEGSPTVLNAFTNEQSFSGTNAITYTYRVTTIDQAGNTNESPCSDFMLIDTAAPVDPTTLTWAEAPGSVTPTVHANWNPSSDTDTVSQTLQFHDDASCGSAILSPIVIGPTESSYTFTGTDGNTYSYEITTIDQAGNSQTSGCSVGLPIDSSPPAAAGSIAWTETSPHNSTQVTSQWAKSASPDLYTQSLQYYDDETCSNKIATVVLDHTPTTNIFVGTTDTTYTYKVISRDASGNSSDSGCSATAMHLDATPPNQSTLMAWDDPSPLNATATASVWTLSSSIDIKSQSIQYYNDGTCGGSIGGAVPLSPSATTHSYIGDDGVTYSFKVTTYDKADNLTESACSTAILMDVSAPSAPGVAGWTETTPHNATSLTAQWITSGSGDVASQSIQYHDNDSCSSPYSSDTVGATDTTVTFVGVNNTTFTYVVTAIDGANNSTPGPCSSAMYIDMDPPTDAASLAWSETHPHDASTINARWTISPSNDVASQSIQFYTGDTCGVTEGSPTVLNAFTNEQSFSGTNAITYTYRVTTIDQAGNTNESPCSDFMLIDTAAPVDPTTLTWAEAPGSVTPTVHANWNPSSDTDTVSQTLQFHDDASCGSAILSPIVIGPTESSYTFTGTDGNTYSYEITTIDQAGNSQTSGCSVGLPIDSSPPAAAGSIAWTETSPHNSTQVTSQWAKSASPDLYTQSLQYYDDETCSNKIATVVLDHTPTTNIFVGTTDTTYTYKVISRDASGNSSDSGCSATVMHLDATPPNQATLTSWAQATPHNSTSATAVWTVSSSIDVKSQSIQYYNDSSCGGAFGGVVPLSATASSHPYVGSDGVTYTFKVTTTDKADNFTESACSTAMTLDTSFPSAPGAGDWTETTPHNATSLTAQWTTSGSGDVVSQSIQYHNNDSCSASYGSAALVGATDTTATFVGVNNSTFTYVVTAIDGAGNATPSPCSTAMFIDMNAPNNAGTLTWTETSPHNATSATASWVVSSSNDVASQSIQFYSDGSCGPTSGVPIPKSRTDNTHFFTGSNGSIYSFKVTTTDQAGNTNESACSSAMLLDATGPSAATSLSWIEGDYHNTTAINATWTVSLSADVVTQTVQFHNNGTCSSADGVPIVLTPGVDNQLHTGTNSTTYSYEVIVTDHAGHTQSSGCSTTIGVDTSSATASIAIESFRVDATHRSLTFTYSEVGISGIQSVECRTSEHDSFTACTSPYNFTVDAETNTFEIRVTDKAGNITTDSFVQTLLHGARTFGECTGEGGTPELTSDTCQINDAGDATCPGGWVQHDDWQTYVARTCGVTSNCNTSCTTGTSAWGDNSSRPSCGYTAGTHTGWDWVSYGYANSGDGPILSDTNDTACQPAFHNHPTCHLGYSASAPTKCYQTSCTPHCQSVTNPTCEARRSQIGCK